MLKVCRLVVALALGLMMSLTLLTSAVFAQSTHNSVPGKATQAVTVTAPQAVSQTLVATTNQQSSRPLFWGRGFHRGFFFLRGLFFPGRWWWGGWGGGWGGWWGGGCGGCGGCW